LLEQHPAHVQLGNGARSAVANCPISEMEVRCGVLLSLQQQRPYGMPTGLRHNYRNCVSETAEPYEICSGTQRLLHVRLLQSPICRVVWMEQFLAWLWCTEEFLAIVANHGVVKWVQSAGFLHYLAGHGLFRHGRGATFAEVRCETAQASV